MKDQVRIVVGYYIQPDPKGMGVKTLYYNIRNNHAYAYNSTVELGLQVLVAYLDTLIWVNIKPEWLCDAVSTQDVSTIHALL